jgi:hypothetical protein
MRFWWREVAGWLLVLLGLVVFYECFVLLVNEHAIFETGPLMLIGIILFRGGIQLLKVALAARIATQAREQVSATRPGAGRPVPLVPQRPVSVRRP